MAYSIKELMELDWSKISDINHGRLYYDMHPILDKDGKPLTQEECEEYENDVWDQGIPMTKEGAMWLWNKWGERLGIEKPKE